MTTTNALAQLSDQGVSVWVDSIARDWLEKGELRRLRDDFGASAPGELVLEKFGFTPDNVADRARALLGRLDAKD